MGTFFSSSTDTDVFAQINPLIPGNVADPVTLAVNIDNFGGLKFDNAFLEETLPSSFSNNIRKIVGRLEDEDGNPNPDYHPFGLPTVILDPDVINYSEPKELKTLPLFWLRNQNIDLNSTFWNMFTERGASYNNKPTPLNDDYWIRDLNDPDINRVPSDESPLLSSRPVPLDAENSVPYELVYPEWFTAHPEYIKTDDILQDLGINVASDIIAPMRDSEDSPNIDHLMFGFFTGILPQKKAEANYLYRYFKEMFKDLAFAAPLVKQTSPCITNAVETTFYDKEGNAVPFISNNGNNLTELQDDNYYYEYKAFLDDPIFGANTENSVFFFEDPRDELSLDFRAENIIIRKVKGTILDGRNGQIEVVAGKGAYFPEFTHAKKALFPVNPTVAPSVPAAFLNAYQNNVTDIHEKLFKGYPIPLFDDVKPSAYLSIKVQRSTNNSTKIRHPWDTETVTNISGAYYEEIIILNPRTVFKGIYSAGHKSHSAYKAFHAADIEDFWLTSDDPNTKKFNGTNYVDDVIGSVFTGSFDESDAIVVPIVYTISKGLKVKDREIVITKAMCTLSLAIVRTRVSAFKEALGVALQVVGIVLAVFTGNISFASIEAFIISVAKAYVRFKAIEFISDEIAEFLVDEFGIELGAQIAAVITLVATGKIVADLSIGLDIDILLAMAANVDDAFLGLTEDLTEENLLLLEERAKENRRSFQRLREDNKDLLADADPNLTRLNQVFLIQNEIPQDFFARTIGNLNPGVLVYPQLRTQIARSKQITFDRLPSLITDEFSDDTYLDNLV